jgi:hypothetical protein
LFSLYSEIIMRNLEGMLGISVGGININNLRYADDTILIATNEEDLQTLMDIIVRESSKMGLSLNKKITEVMVTSKNELEIKSRIKVEGTFLKQVTSFKYLGTIITSDGRCNTEIRSRIGQAKSVFNQMKKNVCNKHVSLQTRKRLVQTYVKSVMYYGCEVWTITKKIQSQLEAAEMWFLRRMMKVPWTVKVSNKIILQMANETRTLIRDIRKRLSNFFGHIIRKEQIEHTVITGKISERRDRGRQREKILDGLARCLGERSITEMINKARDRNGWRYMTVNVCRLGT